MDSKRTRGSGLRVSGLLMALMAAICPLKAYAGSTQPHAPESLADALESFAKVNGYQLVYRAELAKGLQSPGVSPGVSPTETLQQLLRGTQLTFKFINDKTIVLFLSNDDPSAVNPPPQPAVDHREPPRVRAMMPATDTRLQDILVTMALT